MARKSFSRKAGEFLVRALKAVGGFLLKAFVWLAKSARSILSKLFRHATGAVSAAARQTSRAARNAAGPSASFASLARVKPFEGSSPAFEDWLYSSKSTVGIILGARGSGKSGLGMRLLENWASRGRSACAMGFDQSALPSWIRVVESVEQAPNGSVLLVDEGGILFGSRDAMSDANKLLSRLLFVARHKDLSIVFISQNSANLEVNTIRQADYLLLKKPSLLQKDFERNKIRDIYSGVARDFRELGGDKGLVYVYSDAFRGFASNGLPSFWTDRAGKSFRATRL